MAAKGRLTRTEDTLPQWRQVGNTQLLCRGAQGTLRDQASPTPVCARVRVAHMCEPTQPRTAHPAVFYQKPVFKTHLLRSSSRVGQNRPWPEALEDMNEATPGDGAWRGRVLRGNKAQEASPPSPGKARARGTRSFLVNKRETGGGKFLQGLGFVLVLLRWSPPTQKH